jgi:hypothetical protein
MKAMGENRMSGCENRASSRIGDSLLLHAQQTSLRRALAWRIESGRYVERFMAKFDRIDTKRTTSELQEASEFAGPKATKKAAYWESARSLALLHGSYRVACVRKKFSRGLKVDIRLRFLSI